MSRIKIDTENITGFIPDFVSTDELESIQPVISAAHQRLESGTGAGSDFLGWLRLPSMFPAGVLDRIEESADYIRENSDVFICIGVGGSYLGARAGMEFINHTFYNQVAGGGVAVYFAGHNISSDYLADLMEIIREKRVCINVISKSGTTTEPAIAFRILKGMLEKKYGRDEAVKRIIVTTDKAMGTLKKLADAEGYVSFEIPDNIGGRYSVLTPVGLLPMAVSGIDIRELLEGAKRYEEITSSPRLDINPAYTYAAIRNILYRKGKTVEILSSFHPSLHYIGEWWKQLAGESEGKNRQGIFPASVDLTTDLHSMGQWIQEGNRIIFETFMVVENSNRRIDIPLNDDDGDGLNYLAGKSLDYVNDKAYRGTAKAHAEGDVPNMTIMLEDRSPGTLGELIYFFQKAIAISGYLQWVNPFDQPGVEFYKKNMFALLKKPGIT